MADKLIYTNEKCIACNKCVRFCNSPGASVSKPSGVHSVITINFDRCTVCGACIDVCERGARGYNDDTEAFFADLERGEPISLLIAPSFEARYPRSFAKILGGLKVKGVKRIIPVSFGADICTWAYLKLIRERGYAGRIATTCPVVVSYVEHCVPELMDSLMPVLSPMMCAATYCREVLGVTDKLAFIGPCIGKRLEMERYPSLVQYNLTFPKLIEYAKAHEISGPDARAEIEYGLGAFYPASGGLADNIRWFLGDDTPVRVISGKKYLFRWFRENREKLRSCDHDFTLIDALNCHEGCIEGTARVPDDMEKHENGLMEINRIRTASKSQDMDSPWNAALFPAARLRNLDRQFADLKLESYLCDFVDQSDKCEIRIPNEEEADAIFRSMHKDTPESRETNCSACGYDACREMMIAIYNGFNSKRNCVYWENSERIFLERQSFVDQLTSVKNRNAFERMLSGATPKGKPVGMVVADVNGLKFANDNFGHTAGDKLIRTSANALAEVFGRERTYRVGGDEFMVVLEDWYEDEIVAGVQKVRAILERDGASMSIGMKFSERFDGDFNTLMECADEEMYKDKNAYYERTGKDRRHP